MCINIHVDRVFLKKTKIQIRIFVSTWHAKPWYQISLLIFIILILILIFATMIGPGWPDEREWNGNEMGMEWFHSRPPWIGPFEHRLHPSWSWVYSVKLVDMVTVNLSAWSIKVIALQVRKQKIKTAYRS